MPLAAGESPSHRIWLESATSRENGFAERPVGGLDRMTVRVPALEAREESAGEPGWPSVERMLTEALGSRGFGHCAGVDPRRRVFHVLTVDPGLAAPLLRDVLAGAGLGGGLDVAVEPPTG